MNENSKNNTKSPLLYIQQPALKESKANMQQSYSSKDVKLKPAAKPPVEAGMKKARKKKRAYFEEELGSLDGDSSTHPKPQSETDSPKQEAVEETEEKQEQKQKTFSFKPLKPFRDMELDEKINYLSRYINGKAPFPCEFITAEERYKGILLSGGDDVLVVKSFQGDEIEFKRTSLREIKIIGL
ncbi:MAG: CotO family spore coat protein [Bacillota bacterium]